MLKSALSLHVCCTALAYDFPSAWFWELSLPFPCVRACGLWIHAFHFLDLHLGFGEVHPSVTFKKVSEEVKFVRCLYCWKYVSSTLAPGWWFRWSGYRIPRWNNFSSKFKGLHYNFLASGGCWKILRASVFIFYMWPVPVKIVSLSLVYLICPWCCTCLVQIFISCAWNSNGCSTSSIHVRWEERWSSAGVSTFFSLKS